MGRWTHIGGEAKAPAFLRGCLTVTQNKQGRAAGAPVPGQRGGCGWPSRGRLLRGKQEAQHTAARPRREEGWVFCAPGDGLNPPRAVNWIRQAAQEIPSVFL